MVSVLNKLSTNQSLCDRTVRSYHLRKQRWLPGVREVTSCVSGDHLPRIRRSSAMHRNRICHTLVDHLPCIEIVLLMHREVIYHISNSYLPPIGNVVRKQPQRGWSVFIERPSNSGDQNNPPNPPNLRDLNRPRPTALFSLCTS